MRVATFVVIAAVVVGLTFISVADNNPTLSWNGSAIVRMRAHTKQLGSDERGREQERQFRRASDRP